MARPSAQHGTTCRSMRPLMLTPPHRHAQSFSPVIRSQRAPRRVSCCATSSRRELLASTTGAAGLAALLPLLGVASAAHADQLSAIEPMEGENAV